MANYFLCKLKNGSTAKDLALYLLEKHDIFIKDLNGKKGFNDASWLRLAIRNSKDNDFLVQCLYQYKASLC